MSEYNIRVKTYEPTNPIYGRHVRHDSRSRAYAAPEAALTDLKSVRHESNIPTLDQGQIGSCTGNAGTKGMSYAPLWVGEVIEQLKTLDADFDEEYAVKLYSDATVLDGYDGSYPPDDTGSDGLTIAKVLKNRNLISGYTHAFSLTAVLTALQTQAVIVGTEFRADMENPMKDGRLLITGDVQGGHEYVLDEIDTEKQRVWMQNSWSDGWGVDGRGYYTWADLDTLLKADGDCTIFSAANVPAPSPTTPLTKFTAAANVWLSHGHSSAINKSMVLATKEFLAS